MRRARDRSLSTIGSSGREKRFTIGSYPDWSAEAARAEAKELRRRIDRGEDPALERKTQREAPTVRDLAQRYKDEHLPKKANSSQINDWAMIENEILPAIGERKVADVHEGDIEALHRAITERGRAVRANRVLAVASKMFSLTLKRKEGEDAPWRDQAQGNPCKGVARNHEEGHERFFSPAELAALGDALHGIWRHAGRKLPPVHHAHGLSPGRGYAGDVGPVRI